MSNLFDRRRMLLGLAAASTAAATGTVAANAAVAENPELIRLAQELPAFADQYHSAREHQRATEAEWAPQWPIAPDDITEPGTGGLYGHPWERHFHGGSMTRRGEKHPRRIIPAFYFSSDADRCRRALKSKKLLAGPINGRSRAEWETELAESERLHSLAVAYEAETKRISETSAYEASWRAHSAAAKALETHIARMMAVPDFTMEGLIIKAQALEVWSRVGETYRLCQLGADWHGQIAASILRHARAA